MEEYVKGREFSVGVIEGKALPIIEIAPVQGFYDYKNKYKAGSAVETCPAELSEAVTEKMQHYAEQVAQVLGLDTYSRTDFLLDEKENIYCLEANTLPVFRSPSFSHRAYHRLHLTRQFLPASDAQNSPFLPLKSHLWSADFPDGTIRYL